jgi:histidinol-phosphate aminotransferase
MNTDYLSRRGFARAAGLAALSGLWTESALAQRALVGGKVPPGTIWLNANENPAGPGEAAIAAMKEAMATAGRYHFQEWGDHAATIGRSLGLEREQVILGAGSSEVLCDAVHAFTSPSRPLIHSEPTYELPITLAKALGHKAIPVPLTASYAADVKRMRQEAVTAGGGLIFICNPNNPTSSITPKADLDWLANSLPPDTVALIDEAYIHFSTSPQLVSALDHVKAGRNVVVSRTFSKIYGMAGLRVGFGCAKKELIQAMAPFPAGVISCVSIRAALAGLEDPRMVPERQARYIRIRADLCQWLDGQGFRYIQPHGNFMMIDTRRNVRSVIPAMVERGVAPGRPFPPLDNMLRVTIGTETEMEKFKRVFLEVMKAGV